jgi:sulfide:quinone oxidoreductase
MRVLILGAGFGGLELAAALSEHLGEEADVTLIDQRDHFVFGFSKLDVMFGRRQAETVRHPYGAISKQGVRFVHTTVRTIDPTTRRVLTDAGAFTGDVLVVALGADLEPSATPGLIEVGCEFYSNDGALSARRELESFSGGDVIVGVTSIPFKCPPAPSETALLVHDYLTSRGLRDRSTVSLVMPLPAPIPPSPDASAALLVAFEERGIDWHPGRIVTSLDADRRAAVFSDGAELPFDLFLGVPKNVAPAVVLESGMAVDGWIPVDPSTLETTFPDVYAVGDVTSVGTPKAGVFSEGQAGVVASSIVARVRGDAVPAGYDGRGTCYLEFGGDEVARVTVSFLAGMPPVGELEGPSLAIARDKVDFGVSRVRRWFDRDWDLEAREASASP